MRPVLNEIQRRDNKKSIKTGKTEKLHQNFGEKVMAKL